MRHCRDPSVCRVAWEQQRGRQKIRQREFWAITHLPPLLPTPLSQFRKARPRRGVKIHAENGVKRQENTSKRRDVLQAEEIANEVNGNSSFNTGFSSYDQCRASQSLLLQGSIAIEKLFRQRPRKPPTSPAPAADVTARHAPPSFDDWHLDPARGHIYRAV